MTILIRNHNLPFLDNLFKLYLLKLRFLYISKAPNLLYNIIAIFETPKLHNDLFLAI